MSETKFFDKDGILVTNSRFIVPGKTYAMNGVTSIGYVKVDPSRKWPSIIMGLGVLILLSGNTMTGLFFFAIGAAWWNFDKSTHTVILSSASGETKAMESKDGEFISGVVKALNEAIVSRG